MKKTEKLLPLWVIFNDILYKLNISEGVLNNYINDYIDLIAKRKPDITSKRMSSDRHYVKSEIITQMETWKKFCTAMYIIGIHHFTFRLNYLQNGTMVYNEIEVDSLNDCGKKSIEQDDKNEDTLNTNALADLYRKLKLELGIDDEQFKQNYIDEYVRRVSYHIATDHRQKKNIITLKANLKTELVDSTSMTLPVFIKGLQVLRKENISFEILIKGTSLVKMNITSYR